MKPKLGLLKARKRCTVTYFRQIANLKQQFGFIGESISFAQSKHMPGEFSNFIQQTLDRYFRYYHEFPIVGYIYFLSLLFLLGGDGRLIKDKKNYNE